MSAVKLHHYVGMHQHAPNLRKRVRVLRGVRPSKRNELWYRQQLMALVSQFRGIAEPRLIAALPHSAGDGLARDEANGGIARVLADLSTDFAARVKPTAKRLAETVSMRGLVDSDSRLKAAIKESVKVDITGVLHSGGPITTVMQAAVNANVNLITSIPAQYLDKVGAAVQRGMADGLKEVGGVTESRANLIARDQTAKINGAFTSVRQQSLGIKKFTWQTAQDERVRDGHAALDGEVFDWASPPSVGMPGQDINCRCVALPIFELDDGDSGGQGTVVAESLSAASTAATVGAYFGGLSKLD
jgi:SPP1 gp7 family putative phage head morphogenesis protein